jgi:hypothetical protein
MGVYTVLIVVVLAHMARLIRDRALIPQSNLVSALAASVLFLTAAMWLFRRYATERAEPIVDPAAGPPRGKVDGSSPEDS